MLCYGRFDNTEWAGLRSVSVDNVDVILLQDNVAFIGDDSNNNCGACSHIRAANKQSYRDVLRLASTI